MTTPPARWKTAASCWRKMPRRIGMTWTPRWRTPAPWFHCLRHPTFQRCRRCLMLARTQRLRMTRRLCRCLGAPAHWTRTPHFRRHWCCHRSSPGPAGKRRHGTLRWDRKATHTPGHTGRPGIQNPGHNLPRSGSHTRLGWPGSRWWPSTSGSRTTPRWDGGISRWVLHHIPRAGPNRNVRLPGGTPAPKVAAASAVGYTRGHAHA